MPALEQTADLDPRVRRTRVMLQGALSALLGEKSFDRISIAEIAERATLSRATFYDHYPDKDALLGCMIAGRFTELMTRREVVFTGCGGAVRTLALGVCDSLVELAPALRSSEKPLEAAIVEVVRAMILDGIRSHHPASGFPPELVAASIAWAIYGAAREWLRTPGHIPAADAAELISQLLAPLTSPATLSPEKASSG